MEVYVMFIILVDVLTFFVFVGLTEDFLFLDDNFIEDFFGKHTDEI